MTVSTFLAGFTFAALIELLIAQNSPAKWTWHNIAAVACFAFAAALFIASVYVYDQLALEFGQ